MLKTIEKDNVSQIIVKKSRFIASMFYIESEEQANQIIKETKKKYFDAKHNCYAYRINNSNYILEKYSDDGEPSGTAGQPILNVLKGKELENVLIIVTRYFGGILLGTGGLVKAYTDSTIAVMENINIVNKSIGNKVKIEISYNDIDKLNYYMRQNNIKIYKNNFLQNIEVFVEITQEKLENLEKQKNELNFTILRKEIIEKNCYIIVE